MTSSGPADRLSCLARRPAAPLGAFVECCWFASGVSQSERYRVLLNGAIELIINRLEVRRQVPDGETWRAQLTVTSRRQTAAAARAPE